MRKYSNQRDGNEAGIIKAMRAAGASVQQLNVGGCPDLLVGYLGINLLMEVKDPEGALRGAKQAGDLTPQQVEWHDAWRGQKRIVNSEFEAMEMLNVLKEIRKRAKREPNGPESEKDSGEEWKG